MNAYEKELDDKDFCNILNEIYGKVEICGMEFYQGDALSELDPVAFDCMMANEPPIWVCGECESEFENESEAEECCREDNEDD